MTISKKLWTLSAIAALSFSAYACDDDSGSDSNGGGGEEQKAECTVTACDGNILNKCNDGKLEKEDCGTDKVCSAGACIAKEDAPKCTETKCEGDVLKKCDNGTVVEENCAAKSMTCSNNACVAKGTEPVENECEGDTAACDNGVLRKCVDGKFVDEDCDAKGQTCNSEAKTCDPCTEEQSTCDGQVLKLCNNGKLEKTDCTTSNKLCDLQSLSCKFECENTEAPTCANEGVQKVCENNKYKLVECEGENAYCAGGECKTRTAEEICIAEGKVYKDGACVVPETSIIGSECKCLNNCEIVITGKEIKDVLSADVKKFYLKADIIGINVNVEKILAKIKDDDKIIAPNYFPGAENIEGCAGLEAPAGMTAGCFYDAKIQFPAGISQIINEDIVPILENNMVKGMLPNPNVGALAKKMADEYLSADTGIKFTSPKGYCIAATIDIGDKMEASAKVSVSGLAALAVQTNGLDSDLFASDPLNKSTGLVKKINTGDHATVVSGNEAAAAEGKNYCPDGSTLFSYSIAKKIEMADKGTEMMGVSAKLKKLLLNANVGFDMCLQSCHEDTDCRDDYECVELPNGVPETQIDEKNNCKRTIEPPKKKACFDKANIDYFQEMTDIFTPADSKDDMPECADKT